MPSTEFAERLHAEKYRQIGESFPAAMARVAKALADDRDHEEALIDILTAQRFMPAGRIQAAVGAPRRITPYNCLAGETEVVTLERGVVAISELAGSSDHVLDGRGEWTLAPFLAFGRRSLLAVTLTNGRLRRVVRASEDHRWIMLDGSEKTTAQLSRNDRVAHVRRPRPEPSRASVVHGIVYGDGTRTGENRFGIRLCGEKKELLPLFAGHDVTYPPSLRGDPYVSVKSETDLKALPRDPSDFLGFVRGWIAADGCVSTQPDATLAVGEEEYDWLRRWSPISVVGKSELGDETNYGPRKKQVFNAHLSRLDLTSSDLLRTLHRSRWEEDRNPTWRIAAIEPDGEDETYCPSVSTTHSFVLAGGIHTGQCFVSGAIADSFVDGHGSIMTRASEAAETMRLGGGIGYDFSSLRPRGALIKKIQSTSTGPVSFMEIFDAVCRCVSSSGHRRGAQMGVLRVDHPDCLEFVRAKQNQGRLTGFNVSLAVTDEFMQHLQDGYPFPLRFGGKTYSEVDPRELWDEVMRSAWDWGEPGVLFVDRINEMNNLYYCEQIAATNPCVPGDTVILTREGHVRIRDLVGRNVEIWNGEEWAEVRPFSTGVNQLAAVSLSNGRALRCTWGHKFILDGGETREARDLRPGDCLAKFDMPVVEGGEPYDGDAYSQGFYSGDGSSGSDRSWLYWPKYCCADRLQGTVGKEHAVRRFKTWYHGPMLPKTFVPIQGRLSYCVDWFAGLLDSDGCAQGDPASLQVASVDRGFLLDVQLMLTRLGVRAHVGENDHDSPAWNSKPCWRLLVNQVDAQRLVALGLRTERLKIAVAEPRRDARRFVTVESVESIDEAEETFCFTEPRTGRGTFDGVVTAQCGEQPLPPFGACLLGSFNLVRYLQDPAMFDFAQFAKDIPHVVRAMDNVIDRALYPLHEQEIEAVSKRRMGLGVTGLANALEAMGHPYGSAGFLEKEGHVLRTLACEAYRASARLAEEKGPFPLFEADKYLAGRFVKSLPVTVKALIRQHGIRNSHLTSIAPTGTISLCADNVSSGLEPVFAYEMERDVHMVGGKERVKLEDYGVKFLRTRGKTAAEVTPREHLAVLAVASRRVDSGVSKTCNVPSDCPWEEFKSLYFDAWRDGCKGLTVLQTGGKRAAMMCRVDPATGARECSE